MTALSSSMLAGRRPQVLMVLAILTSTVSLTLGVASAVAAPTEAPGWSAIVLPEPTIFRPGLDSECEAKLPAKSTLATCDSYTIVVTNVGAAASSGAVTITDDLPTGVTAIGFFGKVERAEEFSSPYTQGEGDVSCAGEHSVTCSVEVPVASLESIIVQIPVIVEPSVGTEVTDSASVEGGGAVGVVESEPLRTQVGERDAPFEIVEASQHAYSYAGTPDTQAGDHPSALVTSFFYSNHYKSEPATISGGEREERNESPVLSGGYALHDEVFNLPAGLIGDPRALPRCPLSQLRFHDDKSTCPAASRLGSILVRQEGGITGFTGSTLDEFVTPIYNLVPEAGYPAEFGFSFGDIPVVMHAEVGPPPGYVLRVSIPGQTDAITINGAVVSFFGDPAERDNAGSAPTAFLTNPSDCAAEAVDGSISVDTQEDPENFLSKELPTYPSLTGCESLSFTPKLSFTPETTERDTPSGYEAVLSVPQGENVAPYLATPPLRDVKVTLPEGVAISPSEASGLVGCKESGPEGFNDIGGQTAPDGQDLTDTEATELGEGHVGGNSSPYDDGLYHTAPGHCAEASTLGTVTIKTPLLEEELEGHIYLAEPKCGGAGQPECTPQAAEEGKIFGIYLEAAGSGTIIKLTGKVRANASTGQLTAEFEENPQLPFSELHLHFKGGARAPLSNPQTCGSYTTTSLLEPWSAPETPTATSLSSFQVSGCDGFPFAPSFSAGTVSTEGGTFSPFTLTFGRKDGEQDLSQIDVQLPSGLLGEIAGVPRCAEAQANAGTCSAESQIGTVTVAAGSGSAPLSLTGKVYVTGPYAGQPFGLSIVVPAVAGPFNLGDVVVRASIAVNSHTAALTVASTPLPQIIDGVPIRLQSANVYIDRPDFMVNPTNCEKQTLGATITSAQGSSAAVSTPFAASGCKNLPFKPGFTAETHAGHTRKDGDVLRVRVTSGSGQANIAKVAVQLPEKLPVRQETLKLACPEKQFAANPASCEEAVVGMAVAHTPILSAPLKGPVYFVSHAGAAFPELVAILQGEGVTIELQGETFISKKGVTSSKFNSVPDAPISSFEMKLPSGRYSLLTGVGSLCKKTLYMPTKITGQNGAVVEHETKIKVASCAAAKKKKAKKKVKKKKRGAAQRKDRRAAAKHEHAKGKSHRGK